MHKDVVVKKSAIDKNGIFAAKDFKKGEVVLKWNPKVLTRGQVNELPKRELDYIDKVGDKYFLMRFSEKYVNHSCDPNTKPKDNCDVAVRNIKKGEEITSDYSNLGLRSFKCNCGSKNCRGFVGRGRTSSTR